MDLRWGVVGGNPRTPSQNLQRQVHVLRLSPYWSAKPKGFHEKVCQNLIEIHFANVAAAGRGGFGNNGEGQAFEEVQQQVKTCFIKELGIFGHSHGGGSTYNLAKLLDEKRNEIGAFTIPYTGYVDAIKENSVNAEDRFPPSAAYLLNYYQKDGFIDGFSVPGADNHDVTPWGLGHGGIDNDARVIKAISDAAKARINP